MRLGSCSTSRRPMPSRELQERGVFPVCILLTFLCGISSYTFECQVVDGSLPLNQALRLPKYTLIVRVFFRPSLGEVRCADRRRRHPHQFTRAPTVGAITPSTILTPQPANAVARAPSAVGGGSQPVNAASPTATSAPRRTASTVSIGLPPSSPPRTTAPKSTRQSAASRRRAQTERQRNRPSAASSRPTRRRSPRRVALASLPHQPRRPAPHRDLPRRRSAARQPLTRRRSRRRAPVPSRRRAPPPARSASIR